jgi:hypothetical protein
VLVSERAAVVAVSERRVSDLRRGAAGLAVAGFRVDGLGWAALLATVGAVSARAAVDSGRLDTVVSRDWAALLSAAAAAEVPVPMLPAVSAGAPAERCWPPHPSMPASRMPVTEAPILLWADKFRQAPFISARPFMRIPTSFGR